MTFAGVCVLTINKRPSKTYKQIEAELKLLKDVKKLGMRWKLRAHLKNTVLSLKTTTLIIIKNIR